MLSILSFELDLGPRLPASRVHFGPLKAKLFGPWLSRSPSNELKWDIFSYVINGYLLTCPNRLESFEECPKALALFGWSHPSPIVNKNAIAFWWYAHLRVYHPSLLLLGLSLLQQLISQEWKIRRRKRLVIRLSGAATRKKGRKRSCAAARNRPTGDMTRNSVNRCLGQSGTPLREESRIGCLLAIRQVRPNKENCRERLSPYLFGNRAWLVSPGILISCK